MLDSKQDTGPTTSGESTQQLVQQCFRAVSGRSVVIWRTLIYSEDVGRVGSWPFCAARG